ncbi:uncharacterized protein LOC119100093 [Pollicipes pollicipes]|uniref:uncharacterized protein LOC119100093 n=1 Tax=Pollicipes pollicipes TaxID=41117 RepID=UPI0018858F78|nr:uncharacterized protein LOC119100093 [Pollicipes pollicipes]
MIHPLSAHLSAVFRHRMSNSRRGGGCRSGLDGWCARAGRVTLPASRYGHLGAPPAHAVDAHHEHSDSGLGNESPNEFTRMTNGSPVLSLAATSRVSSAPLAVAAAATSESDRVSPALSPLYDCALPGSRTPGPRPPPAWTASLPRPPAATTASSPVTNCPSTTNAGFESGGGVPGLNGFVTELRQLMSVERGERTWAQSDSSATATPRAVPSVAAGHRSDVHLPQRLHEIATPL